MARRIEIQAILDAAGVKRGSAEWKAGMAAAKTQTDIASKSLRESESAMRSLKNTSRDLAGALGLGLGLAAFVSQLKAISAEAATDEQALRRVDTQLKVLNITTRAGNEEIMGMASRMQRLTGIADQEVLLAFQKLLALTTDYQGSLRNTNLVLDIAATGLLDVDNAARVVAFAMEGDVLAIKRFLPGMKDLVNEHDHMLPTLERSRRLLEALDRRFSGTALQNLYGFTGAVTELRRSFEDLESSIGKVINLPLAEFFRTTARDIELGLKTPEKGKGVGGGRLPFSPRVITDTGEIISMDEALTRARAQGNLAPLKPGPFPGMGALRTMEFELIPGPEARDWLQKLEHISHGLMQGVEQLQWEEKHPEGLKPTPFTAWEFREALNALRLNVPYQYGPEARRIRPFRPEEQLRGMEAETEMRQISGFEQIDFRQQHKQEAQDWLESRRNAMQEFQQEQQATADEVARRFTDVWAIFEMGGKRSADALKQYLKRELVEFLAKSFASFFVPGSQPFGLAKLIGIGK